MLNRIRESLREAKDLAAVTAQFVEVCPDRAERARVLKRFREIHRAVPCPHNASHILTFVVEVYRFHRDHPGQNGVLVEAGCFKGGSSAKLSLVAKRFDRRLLLCDSFEGIPENEERHEHSIFGDSIKNWFVQGAFAGSLEEVRTSVGRLGHLEVCEFVPGWFEDTLPSLQEPIIGAYLDVDLAASTKTCLKYLYPRLVPGGFIVSQDGDFPLVVEAVDDDRFWEAEVGCKKPVIHGLRSRKMLRIYREG